MTGSVVSRSLMLCATILVARMLGKSTYGEFGMIQSTTQMFAVVAGFGLSLTATKYIAELRQRDSARSGRILGLSTVVAAGTGGVMALALLIFAPWLAENTIKAPHLTNLLRIGALMMFINAINGAQTGALSGFEAFKTIAYVNLSVGLMSFPILVAGAYYGGLTGAVWGLVVNLCFNWLLNHIALRHEERRHKVTPSYRDCGREISVLTSFSLPAALSGIMVAPAMWGCRAILVNQPDGYAELGIFTAAIVFQASLFFVTSMIARPLLSMISNAGDNISDQLAAINIIGPWSVGVIALMPLLCFPEIAAVIFGQDYYGYSYKVTLSLVIFYSSIMIYMAGLSRVLASRNLLWWGFVSKLFWAVVLMLSTLYFIRWGAIGLATSFTIAYLANTLILLPAFYIKKLIPIGTLVSFSSLLVWLTLGGLVFLNIYDVSLLPRSFAFISGMLLIIPALYRTLQRFTTNS